MTGDEPSGVREAAVAAFGDLVPQTFGEAVGIWGSGVVHCPPHEWDNRTTWENAQWLLRRLATLVGRPRP